MQVMLQLQPATAVMLRRRLPASEAADELLRKAQKLGVVLRSLRAPSMGSALASGFTVEVPDRATADRVIQELQDCDAVEAAYLVPPTELCASCAA